MGSTAAIRTYQQPDAVVFLKTKEAFGGLSNMASGYPLLVNGIRILSSEALYQACRFPSLPDVQRLVIQQTSPMTAKMVSKPYRAQSRPDWERVRVKIMRWCLRVKLAQHRQAFGKLLLETGDLPIVEKSFKDEYWGAKPTYADTLVGMNVLGRLLMELREELKSGEFDAKAFLETPAIPDFLLDGKPIEPITMNQKAFTLSLQPTLFDPMPTTAPEITLATTMQTFPKYETYKDSEVAWLASIPVQWEIIRSKHVFTQRTERARKDDVQLSATQAYGVIPQDEYEGRIGRKVTKIQFHLEKRKHVEIDDFVISMRSFQGGLERAYATGCIRSSYVVLQPLVKINPSYYTYLFKSQRYIEALQATASFIRDGQDLSFENFSKVDLVLPPCEEQTIIANFLDQKTAQIDAAIAIKEQQITLLKERKQILIQQAVTQGLDPTVPMKDSGVEWIGEIPAHWDVLIMNYVIDAIGDVDHYMPQSIESGVPYVMTGDLKEFASSINFEDCKKVSHRNYQKLSKKIKSSKGDVILARYATIGTTSYIDIDVDFLVSYSCVTIKPNPLRLIGLYLFYYLKSDSFFQDVKSQVNTNTQGNVGIGDLKKVMIVLPPLTEQLKVAQFLKNENDKFDELIALQKQQIEKLREYKTTLINSAVTGKIRVPDMAA